MATFPKTRDQLLEESHFVYVGRITGVREREVTGADGPTTLFEAGMDVEDVEKSILGDGEQRLTLHYWQAGAREDPGDGGQHSSPAEGARIRAFVRYDAEGRAQLLDPNGWEPAQP